MTTLTTLDPLRILFVSADKNPGGQSVGQRQTFQQGMMFTDLQKGYVRLVKRVTDPDLFTPDFAEAASLKLAADLAAVETGSVEDAARLEGKANRMLENADTLYSAEAPPTLIRQVTNPFRGGDEFFDGQTGYGFDEGY